MAATSFWPISAAGASGPTTTTPPPGKSSTRSPTSLVATDLDSDGKDDVVGAFGNAGLLARYNNAGAIVRLRAGPSQAITAGGFN